MTSIHVSWRDKPMTEKQIEMIKNMYANTEIPIPKFEGRTRGEASDFIDKWLSTTHESILSCWDTTQGFD